MGPEGTLAAVDGRPARGEELNAGRATEPRQAATVIVLRGGSERLEVLLVQRNPAARFMGGAWVFPGGAVDAGEDHRAAGIREVREEAGLEVDALIPFSRWITPPQVRIRFDTVFFLASRPPAPSRGPTAARPSTCGGSLRAAPSPTGATRSRRCSRRSRRSRRSRASARPTSCWRGPTAARSSRSSRRWWSRARSPRGAAGGAGLSRVSL